MGAEDTVLLSTSYFGPVQYFSKFILYPFRYIEQFDHYAKQTYRNRCVIAGANGSLVLSIPVRKGANHKTPVKEVRIDYSRDWRKLHWKGLESSYRQSPFFEYYMEDLHTLLQKSHLFLLDLNLEILDYMLAALDISGTYTLTSEYGKPGSLSCVDNRENIHPKADAGLDPYFRAEPYAQVFGERSGFLKNLSIVDLLFNEGPRARTILEKCVRSLSG